MKKVRNAIVGLGRIGSSLEDDRLREKPASHAGVIHAHPGCVLVGGCDIKEERRRAFARRWSCREVYSSVDEMLAQTRPDILHIATPPETHLEMVEKALRHRIRVVICEKPLAGNRLQAYRIARLHARGALTILTNHERRYSEDYKRAKKAVEAQHFGKLRSITGKICMEEKKPLSSVLWNDGTHLIDALHFLTSAKMKLHAVYGDLRQTEVSFFIIGVAGVVPVMVEAGAGNDYLLFEIDLGFDAGRIRIGNGLYEEYSSDVSPFYEHMRSLRKVKVKPERPETWPDGPTRYFTGMLEDALLCLRKKHTQPVSSAVDGYLALAVIDRALRLSQGALR
jgi:predicted dehydrogenase